MKFTCVTKRCKRRGQEVKTSLLNPTCPTCTKLLAGPTLDVPTYMQGRSYRLKGESA